MPVATENHIRDEADAAIGYPRFGLLDLLKLLSGLLVGVQIACGSRGRNGISAPAAGLRRVSMRIRSTMMWYRKMPLGRRG
jgi:hypothetical protein